jgi:hypothetical protein
VTPFPRRQSKGGAGGRGVGRPPSKEGLCPEDAPWLATHPRLEEDVVEADDDVAVLPERAGR